MLGEVNLAALQAGAKPVDTQFLDPGLGGIIGRDLPGDLRIKNVQPALVGGDLICQRFERRR